MSRYFGKPYCRSSTVCFVLFLLLALPVTVLGGTGTYTDASPDQLELRVLFMYDEDDPQAWEPMFEEASKLLYNATEKQVRFSKVIFYNDCPEVDQVADVKIYPDNLGAKAHVGGLGVRGWRIRLSQTHETVTTSGAGDRGQFGLVHELGHYVFALRDEYRDKNGDKSSGAYCIDQDGTTASIMDGGTTVDPENRRTELCWSGNHRTGHTHQDLRRNIGSTVYEDTDSWTWLVDYVQHRYGATLVAPTGDPTDDVGGYGSATVFEHRDCGLRAVVCVDRSGSMSATSASRLADGAPAQPPALFTLTAPRSSAPIDLAKLGAASVVQLLEPGERAAVTSFSSTATTNFAMADMTPANQAAARAAIDGLVATGTTNIGGGLATSLAQITGDGDPVGSEVVILLSDGQHNTGTPPASVVPQLRARGVVVHTLGLGQVDAGLMSRLAADTGGTYLFAQTAGQIKSHFVDLIQKARSTPLLSSEEASLAAGESVQEEVFVGSPSGAGGVTFLLSWTDPSLELDLALESPDGATVDGSTPGVTVSYQPQLALKEMRVDGPAPGTWNVRVGNPSGSDEEVALRVYTREQGASLAATALEQELTYPQPLQLQAILQQDDAITGATLFAEIERPGRGRVTLPLFDDGAAHHGDELAGDGVYSATFRGFTGDGSYTVLVRGDSAGGVTTSGGQEEGDDFVPQPVPRFLREDRFSVVVSGMASVDGDLDGVLDGDEDGAPGFGDFNADGFADSDQASVASLPTPVGGEYVSLALEGSGCEQLSGVTALVPAPQIPNTEAPLGALSFLVECSAGSVEIRTEDAGPSTSYRVLRYGSTPDDPTPRWYDFAFDGTTGAEILGGRVVVHLVDGERGDDDGVQDGSVTVDQLVLVPAPRSIHDIPSLSAVGLVLLSLLLGIAGFLRSRFV